MILPPLSVAMMVKPGHDPFPVSCAEPVILHHYHDFSDVVKTTIFLSDMGLFNSVNEVYGRFFDGDYPARETVAVKGLPRNVNVEISMIAVKGE